MQTPPFVSGPFRLSDRSLVVTHPDVAVLFKNGVPLKPLPPGVHRAIFAKLPAFGELDYLLFDAAEFGVDYQFDGIALRDGRVVSVQVGAWIEPAWLASPEVIFEYAARFGVRAERYLETVEIALFEALRREAVRACAGLTHDEFLHVDLGRYIDPKMASTPLAVVSRIVGVTPIADPHVLNLVQVLQGNELAMAATMGDLATRRLSDDYDFEARRRADGYELGQRRIQDLYLLEQKRREADLDMELTQIRDLYDDEVSQRRAIAQARVHHQVAEVLGVDAWSAAYPEAANELRLRQAEMLGSLLTEYRDLLSPDDIRRASEALVGGPATAGTATERPALPRLPGDVVREVREDVTSNPSVLRAGVGVATAGDRAVVCIAAASLPGAEIVRAPDALAQRTGAAEVNAVPVTRLGDVREVAVEVLSQAFTQKGMPQADLSISESAGTTIVTAALVGQISDAELVAARLRAWADVIGELAAPDSFALEISAS